MTKNTRYTVHGFIMLIAPLFSILAFDWYLLLTDYYLVPFGIFVYAELGWKSFSLMPKIRIDQYLPGY